MRTVAELSLIALLFVANGCGKDDQSTEPSAGAGSSDESAGVPEAPTTELTKPDDAGGGDVGLKIPHKAVETPEPKRLVEGCELDIAPAEAVDCGDFPMGDVAVGPDGAVYWMQHGVGVRRLVPQPGDSCRLTADKGFGKAGVMALPKPPPVGQKLSGKVYMRSGGPSFAFTTGPDGALYVYDYLDGLHRIAGTAGPDHCVGVQGLSAVAFRGKTPLAARGGDIVPLAAKGKSCSAGKPVASPLNMITSLLGTGGAIYAGGTSKTGKKKLVRLDGKKVAWTAGADDAFAEGGMCWVGELADCGDEICVVDGNCQKISRFSKKDGAFTGAWTNEDLFGGPIYKIEGLAAGKDGNLWMSLALKRKDGKCQGVVWRYKPGGKAAAAGGVK